MECARELAAAEAVRTWPKGAEGRPVTVYFDRSGSMRGFLDPQYETAGRTDYRLVIDRLIVGLRPEEAYGFGTTLRQAPASLGALGDREFYRDNNTEMELALARVAHDTALERTHVLVGDGRRGSPNHANAQFVEMRENAVRWVEGGGTFMVGASLAPFQPIEDDPAGCRDASDERTTCPLYSFAYVAPGDEARIASALASVFEHLYVWPLPAVPSEDLQLWPEETRPDLQLDRAWTRAGGAPIARVGGAQATNDLLRADLVVRDSLSPAGRLYTSALAGQGMRQELAARPLRRPTGEWSPAGGGGSLVRPVEGEPRSVRFVTRGREAPMTLYRIELYPTGVPAWLNTFAAEDADDALRTFGLGRLFEAFRQAAPREAAPAARAFVVAQ